MTEHSVKVSVIIPVYNTEKYVGKCLDSLTNQTLKEIEIILINDGSADKSLSVCQRYARKDPRIQIYSQKNKGASAARNLGLSHMKGDFFCFVGSDDYVDKDYLEKLYSSAIENDADFSVANMIAFGADTKDNEDFNRFYRSQFHSPTFPIDPLLLPVEACGKLFKNDFIKKHHLKFPVGLVFEDNYWLFMTCHYAKKYTVVPEVSYLYRKDNPTSVMKFTRFQDDHKYDLLKICCTIFDDLKRENDTILLEKLDEFFLCKMLWIASKNPLKINNFELKKEVDAYIVRSPKITKQLEKILKIDVSRVFDNPKISVIVPVWNAERYLNQCLDSIVKQTLKEIEIILIDDGSTDTSLSICQDYAEKDSRISVYTQSNTGAGYTRNRGFKLARGEYLAFLDSDDFFDLDMLEKLYSKAKATDADIVVCDWILLNEKTQKESSVPYSFRKELLPQKNVFCATDCPDEILNFTSVVWNQIYKRDFILNEKLYYQNLPNSNDTFFSTTTFMVAKRIAFFNKKFVHHRQYQGSTVTRREEAWTAPIETMKALKNFLIERKLFKPFEFAYIKRAINTFLVCRTLREPILGIWQNYLIKNFSDFMEKCISLNLAKPELEKIFRQQNLTPLLEDFYYHKKDKIVPIVFSVNEKFVPYLAVAIQSVIHHAKSDRFYDIYVLHTDLTEVSQSSLEGLTHDNIRVSCLNVSEKLNGINLYDKDHYSIAMWYRLFIPELFYGYDKVLYLDSDLIAESDVAELFDIDLGDAWIGACRSYAVYEYAENTLHLIGETYFNSGVLLFNIPEWKENDVTSLCLKLIDPEKKYKFPDQDILNLVCQNHTFMLPPVWNCAWYYFSNENTPWFGWWYEQTFKNAKIIHYSSGEKPWNKPKKRLAERWWKYARQTAFYERILFQNLHKKESVDSKTTTPIVIKKDSLMAQKENVYSDMTKFVKGSFACLFSFGEKKKKRQEELGKLLVDMSKKV